MRRLPVAIFARHNLNDPAAPKNLYPFVHRVAREYDHLWRNDLKHKKKCDEYHFNRDDLTIQAISAVLRQVRPRSDVCYEDAEEAIGDILPILEQLFDMPGAGDTRGSNQWISEQLSNPSEISFADAVEFPQLHNALVNHFIMIGDSKGYPPFPEDTDKIPGPDEYYDPDKDGSGSTLRCNKEHTAPNRVLIFFRSGGHNDAAEGCQNKGVYPVIVKGENPTGAPWNNIPQVCKTHVRTHVSANTPTHAQTNVRTHVSANTPTHAQITCVRMFAQAHLRML